ncbi:MAG: YihY/virulence factor BrkB family protein [Actinobacteria bacterium]|nr:YihY/virulence factor BrkB family protein [Actinomycetota bacterium]
MGTDPERSQSELRDPGLGDLSRRDWVAILKRAVKESLDDAIPMTASALAYSSFFAIPSTLLLALGLFTLLSDAETIRDFMDRLDAFMPADATQLLGDSLTRLEEQPSAGILLTILGLVLALWASTSAMTTYMAALNIAYDRKDGRSFVRKRLVALGLVAAMGSAVVLVVFLLILGPYAQRGVGDLLGVESVLSWAWWVVQWPLLVGGLLAAFALLHYFGPDVEHRAWRFVVPGSAIAVVVWLLVSAAFAVYTGLFESYNKTWGSLSAVIVTLTWLWLTGLALLFGGEVNSEVERSRELRQGQPAETDVLAPRRSDKGT